jgi:hypothetical protein
MNFFSYIVAWASALNLNWKKIVWRGLGFLPAVLAAVLGGDLLAACPILSTPWLIGLGLVVVSQVGTGMLWATTETRRLDASG